MFESVATSTEAAQTSRFDQAKASNLMSPQPGNRLRVPIRTIKSPKTPFIGQSRQKPEIQTTQNFGLYSIDIDLPNLVGSQYSVK